MDDNLDCCKLVFSLANETYKDYKHNEDWEKALRPDVDNASAMINDPTHPSGTNTCWNCGELDCNVMACPKPKDIKINQFNQVSPIYIDIFTSRLTHRELCVLCQRTVLSLCS